MRIKYGIETNVGNHHLMLTNRGWSRKTDGLFLTRFKWIAENIHKNMSKKVSCELKIMEIIENE